MTIKSCFSLVEEAKQKIKSINFKNAMKLHNEGETIFIDLRDIRELEKNGKIKNVLPSLCNFIAFLKLILFIFCFASSTREKQDLIVILLVSNRLILII